MEKKKIKKEVFSKHKSTPFTWKDLKNFQFEDDDEIIVTYVEPFYSENNSHDGYYLAEVHRMVLETDQEFQKRVANEEAYKKEMKERRYKNYLVLKKEFEPEKE